MDTGARLAIFAIVEQNHGVSLAEYLLVLRVLFPIVADGTVYHGYCKSCFYPTMDEE